MTYAVKSAVNGSKTGPTLRPPLPARRETFSSPHPATVFGPAGRPVVQAQLRVGEPDDEYEREAERVADTVTRGGLPENMPNVSRIAGAPAVQSLCEECEEELQSGPGGALQRLCNARDAESSRAGSVASAAVEQRINGLRGGGASLEPGARSFFEPRFGRDFSAVRVHHDETSARALGARAFTVGSDIVFAAGEYAPRTPGGMRLLAHELTHVVQQGAARPAGGTGPVMQARGAPESVQRAGDPAAIPAGLTCPTDLGSGRPAGTDLLFPVGGFAITGTHTTALRGFVTAWTASGGTDDVIIHGYASTEGDQGPNWTLSCNRAEVVRGELVRLGIPAVRISVLAHGESTDFGASRADNRRAVVTSRAAGPTPSPAITGTLTPADNFAGRSTRRFGVGEVINLGFRSTPPRPAADFGGLTWHLVSGNGTLTGAGNAGTATFTAAATAGAVELELRVAGGATAGRVISNHRIDVVEPDGVNLTAVPGSAPSFGGWGAPAIAAGTWGAGFRADVFVDPKDVSFRGVVFGEGTVAGVVTPAGSYLDTHFGGTVHPRNTFGPGHAGNSATGTPVSPPRDGIWMFAPPASTPLGIPLCGVSDFLWRIPWEFSVSGSARRRFADADHHFTSTTFCNAEAEKGGAGPFCRRIDGTVC